MPITEGTRDRIVARHRHDGWVSTNKKKIVSQYGPADVMMFILHRLHRGRISICRVQTAHVGIDFKKKYERCNNPFSR